MVHIAIIMDGNGRWANQRGLPRMEGHVAGLHTLKTIAVYGASLNIEYMTVYAFSVQNWSRPIAEIKGLFELANSCFASLDVFQKANIRLRIQGFLDLYPASVQKTIQTALQQTEKNTGMVLTIALSYGGQEEIVDAVDTLCRRGCTGHLLVRDFEAVLNPDKIPPPDLIIRTSGEFRISNFLLWQSAYAEYWIVDTLWPDFTPTDLEKALAILQSRDRRFGKVGPPQPLAEIPSLSETSTQFRLRFKKAASGSGLFSEMQKYVDNSFMRNKYARLYSTALTNVPKTYEAFQEACEALWNSMNSYVGSEPALKTWLRCIYLGSWLQTRHSFDLRGCPSFKTTNPVELFRYLKKCLTGPHIAESEEIIKEHILELSEENRSLYLECMTHNMKCDSFSLCHGILLTLLPFHKQGISIDHLYLISFFLVAILYPLNLPVSSVQCMEYALLEMGPVTLHPLLSKLKIGLVYFYLFSEKQRISSIPHLFQYIQQILYPSIE